MKRLLLSFLAVATLFSSCHFMGGKHVRGDGNVVKQTRDVKSFSNIDVSSALDVVITQDSSSSVTVEIDNNLQQFIEVFVEGDVLHIQQANRVNLDPTKDIRIRVSAPTFHRLEASGASNLSSNSRITSADPIEIGLSGACNSTLDIKAPKVSVDLSGASGINIKGETRDFDVQGSGASHVKAFELLAENVTADISGAGDLEVFASSKLSVTGSGASSVKYKGAGTLNSNMSGASDIKKVD